MSTLNLLLVLASTAPLSSLKCRNCFEYDVDKSDPMQTLVIASITNEMSEFKIGFQE